MSENHDLAVVPGRPVRLVPTPRGFWMTLLGVVVAILAPLFGFLIGSASGMPDGDPLLSPLPTVRTVIMCSEAVWWRCHRRIVADVAMLTHGVPVRHLMHDGRSVEHPVSEGARVRADGVLVWDGADE